MAPGSAWSDEEKSFLLINIIDALGGRIPWDNIQYPEGRTKKAAMHVIGKLREEAKSIKLGSKSLTPSSGTANRKRKGIASDMDSLTPKKSVTPSPSPKKARCCTPKKWFTLEKKDNLPMEPVNTVMKVEEPNTEDEGASLDAEFEAELFGYDSEASDPFEV